MSSHMPRSMFLEGLQLCEKNAVFLLKKAVQAYKRKSYRLAFFLGFTAWEEFGKALLILEHWERSSISSELWRRPFKYHIDKIKKSLKATGNMIRQKMLENYEEIKNKVKIDEDYLKRFYNLRNNSLYVGFNFNEQKWSSPFNIENIDGNAALMIILATDAKRSLQIEKRKILIHKHASEGNSDEKA